MTSTNLIKIICELEYMDYDFRDIKTNFFFTCKGTRYDITLEKSEGKVKNFYMKEIQNEDN